MAEIAFVVRVAQWKAASLGSMIPEGIELARVVQKNIPVANTVEFIEVIKSDSKLVPDVYAALTTSNTPAGPTAARTGKVTTTRQTIVGGAAGNLTLSTAVALTDTIVSVVSVDDTTHAGTDLTSQFTITGTTTINNTGGTATTGGHVVVVTQAQ